MERFDYGLLQQYDRLPAGRGAGDQPGYSCSTRLGVGRLLDAQLQIMTAAQCIGYLRVPLALRSGYVRRVPTTSDTA